MKIPFLIFLTLTIIGCKNHNDQKQNLVSYKIQNYKPFKEKIDSLEINPGIEYDYFEYKIGPKSKTTLISKSKLNGKRKQNQLKTSFDSIQVQKGFSEFPHIYGFHYIISSKNEIIQIWNSKEELKKFLGDIDTETEALIYSMAQGFPPIANDTTQTAVKKENGFYIVRATRMDSLCDPIITNRYTFKIDKNGILDTLETKEIFRDEKGCI